MTEPGGQITTHVLDAARGRPAAGIAIKVTRLSPPPETVLCEAATGAGGRTAAALVAGADLVVGEYEIAFAAGAYFAADERETFFTDVRLQFEVADEHGHHHVPLILSPFAYTTYRGSP